MSKRRVIKLALFTALLASMLLTALTQTLTVKDSENPKWLVNTDTNTALRLRVSVPNQPLLKGSSCDVRVELHNTGFRIEVIYMPALTMWPAFRPDKTSGFLDQYDPPMMFGRASAKQEGLNYVVLMGGDYYGRTYSWTPPTSGAVTFHAAYQNKATGPSRRLQAWRGELHAESAPFRVIEK